MVFNGVYAAESAKSATVTEWLQLACDLHEGKVGYLHCLPDDVHHNIFSRIHPRPALDDWQSNNMVCIRSITVPHNIVSFDIKDNRLAYMALNQAKQNRCDPCWVDLDTDTDEHRVLCKEGVGFEGDNKAPAIQWCGDAIIAEQNVSERRFVAVNIFEKADYDYDWGGKCLVPLKLLGSNTEATQCAVHPSLPLCAVSQKVPNVGAAFGVVLFDIVIYENFKKIGETKVLCASQNAPQKHMLKWHNIKRHLYIYRPFSADNLFKKQWFGDNVTSYQLCHTGEPHFSPDGALIFIKGCYGKSNIGNEDPSYLVGADSESLKVALPKDNLVIRGTGYFSCLAEEAATEGGGNKQYTLYSLIGSPHKPLTELNNLPPLHKLPSCDDYRCVTVEPNRDGCSSDVKIFVPKINATFKHYCVFQAGLQAQKSGDAHDWQVFAKPEYAPLVKETAECYVYFKQLMKQKDILLSQAKA